MTQLQVYSKKHLFSNWINITTKVVFIGLILLYIFLEIRKRVKKYLDKIHSLESKLIEMNEKYSILHGVLNTYKSENKMLLTRLIKDQGDFVCQTEANMEFQESRCLKLAEEIMFLGYYKNRTEWLETIVNKQTNHIENIKNENQECIRKITIYSEHLSFLEEELSHMNHAKLLNDKVIENTCAELANLNSRMIDNGIFIGCKLQQGTVMPVIEISNNSTNIFKVICDCFIVSQLKHFKNIKEINIMNVTDKMFIFGHIELNELYSLSGNPGTSNSMLNVGRIVEQNNPNYFIVFKGLFCYSSGYSNGSSLYLFKESYDVKMYVKTGVKKLYEQLKEMNIELTMPDELHRFVFN